MEVKPGTSLESARMTSDEIRRNDHEGVVTVTLTRDEKMNAMTPAMFDVLESAVRDLGDRDDLRVLVITAEGRFFTAGLDVSSLRLDVARAPTAPCAARTSAGSTGPRPTTISSTRSSRSRSRSCWQPSRTAWESASSSARRVTSCSCPTLPPSALPEVPNLAVIPGSGGISRLTRLVGPHWTKWLVMAGETIDAATAREVGFLHAVYPEAEFRERVDAFADRLAAMPREALGLAKVAIDTAATVDRRTAREFDRMAQTLLFTSDDFQDRVTAFMQRGRK